MLMCQSYREDLMEHIRNTPDELFASRGLTKESVLADSDAIYRMWAIYQKGVTEYDCEVADALRNAMESVLGIPATERRKHIWLRLGVAVEITDAEEKKIFGNDPAVTELTLCSIIAANRFIPAGDSYIPGPAVEAFNEEYRTAYKPGDIGFHV